MVGVSESTLLLGGPEISNNERNQPGTNVQRAALVILGSAALMVGWKSYFVGTRLSDPTQASTILNVDSTSKSNKDMDTVTFDRMFYKWESNLYKRSQLAPMLGNIKHGSDTPLIKSNNEGDEKDDDLIYLNHTQAFDMFVSTNMSLTRDFYYYQQGWDAQINQAYCAVASSMAAINSLRGKLILPQDPVYVPYPWATQVDLINNECVRQNLYDVDKMDHLFWGLGLEMATVLLNCHLKPQGWIATPYHVDPNARTPDDIRSTFINALYDEDARLLINYDRGGISQGPMGHGHFSPIGAYHSETDAFLVMDVAKYKYPPVWVPTSQLLGGIGSLDSCAYFDYPDHSFDISYPTGEIAQLLGCQAKYRGYILITKDAEDETAQ